MRNGEHQWKAVKREAFAVESNNVDLADEEWQLFTGAIIDSSLRSQCSPGGV
jgi:hypothetical protein